jgi:hypothetical protein
MDAADPMDRFLSSYGSTLQLFDEQTRDVDLTDPASSLDFTKALQEVQMANWAMEMAINHRHSLLKKVMNEMH